MKRGVPWFAALAALLLAGACFAQSVQVVDLPTRPGVNQRMLVLQPEKPTAVLVLMTGGSGRLGIYDNGSMRFDTNFLVRSRAMFVQRGYVSVLLDVPSDHNSAPFLGGTFRESDEHAADIGAAVAWARGKWDLPVWLVGTSRRGPPAARPVQEMALDKLRGPVLVTHHEQDQCQVCSPSLLPALMARLPPARSKLVTYQGGRSAGNPCEAMAFHGYNGIEEKVVDDIAAFVAAHSKQRP